MLNTFQNFTQFFFVIINQLMLVYVNILQDKIRIYKIIIFNSFFCFILRKSHVLDHPFLQSLFSYLLRYIYEESLLKHMFLQLIPRFLFKKNVKAFNNYKICLFAIKFQFVFFWIFLGMIKLREATMPVYGSKSDIINKSLRVKSELSSSPCMCK